jgi:hypothetical protein
MSQHIPPSPRIPHSPNSESHLPGMINLDPELDPAPSSPPKPSASHSQPDTHSPSSNSNFPPAAPPVPIPEAEVSFVGGTNADEIASSTEPPNPLSSNTHTSHPAVSLSGDTAEDVPPLLPRLSLLPNLIQNPPVNLPLPPTRFLRRIIPPTQFRHFMTNGLLFSPILIIALIFLTTALRLRKT